MAYLETSNIVKKEVHDESDNIYSINRELHANPELGLNEVFAHKFITDYLTKKGFNVEKSYVLPTAFRVEVSSSDFRKQDHATAAICCEYDALPGIGHGCGHNLIAATSVGAFLGAAAALRSGKVSGRVVLLGTPAEEMHGGKCDLIAKGALDGIDFAMMAHGGPFDYVYPNVLGRDGYACTFSGVGAHAACGPWEGVNALDGCVSAYNNLSMLRQQCKPNWRIHKIIREGGTKMNIIPQRAVLEVGFRAPTKTELEILKKKVLNAITSGATATGCTVDFSNICGNEYDPMLHNRHLGGIFTNKQAEQGIEQEEEGAILHYSTDMGNVSLKVPSIHPNFKPGPSASGSCLHTEKFAALSVTPEAHEFSLKTGISLALTCLEVWCGGTELMKKIKAEYDREIRKF